VRGPKVPLLLGVGELAFRAAALVPLVLSGPGLSFAEAAADVEGDADVAGDADVEGGAEPGVPGVPLAAGGEGACAR